MARIAYVPAIDGLRTLAIVPVILFHLGLTWIPGGFAGVDVFFVISGYLITSIIVDECRCGTFTFADFWRRRVRRILPGLTAMVLLTLLAGYTLRYGRDVQDLGLQGVAALVSLANICLWQSAGDYWGSAAEHALLLHTWSLSVEEQFYLFFPPLLYWLMRRAPHRLVSVVGVLVLVSLLLYLVRAEQHPSETFYLLPARIWELGAGALLAIWFFRRPEWRPARMYRWLAVLGLLFIAFSYAWLNDTRVAKGALLLPVIGTVLVILDQHHGDSLLNRWLASGPMVKIGQLSYSLYLWHWPVIVLVREQFPQVIFWQLHIAMLLLTAILAWLSYCLVEQPARHHPRTLRWIGVVVLAVLLLAVAAYRTGKFLDVSAYAPTVWRGPLYDVAPVPVEAYERWRREGLQVVQPVRFDAEAHARDGIVQRYGDGQPDIVLLGDSISLAIAGQLDDIARERHLDVAFFSARGTPVFPQLPGGDKPTRFFTAKQRQAFDRARRERLVQWQPDSVVIAGSWASLADPAEQAVARAFIASLSAVSTRVILLEQPPELATGDVTVVQYLSHAGILPGGGPYTFPEKSSHAYEVGQAFVRKLAADCVVCVYVPTRDLFESAGGQVLVLDGRDVLYRDDDHLSDAGALRLRARLAAVLVETPRIP